MKKLAVCFVLDDSLDRPDGVQQYVTTLGRWLERAGHRVQYIAGAPQSRDNTKEHILSKNVRVRFNGNRLSLPLPADRTKIKALLKAENFDVLHVQLPCSPWLAGRVVQAASPQTAIIGTFHIVPESSIVQLASRGLKLYEHNILKRFQAVMSVSSVAQAFARDTFDLKSLVIPNVIDLTTYQSPSAKLTVNSKVTIAFLGRLVERKGCEYLLQAIVELNKKPQLKPFRVLIAGQGPLEASLKQYVAKNGLKPYVEFLGFIKEADKPKFLSRADIAVFPSTGGESFGIVLLEAMAAAPGVVLAGNNEGYASVMKPHKDQLFVPQQSQQLADKLAYYIQSKAARQTAHNWQIEHVRKYSVETIGPRVVKQYTQALRRCRDVR